MTKIGIVNCENRSLTCAGEKCLRDLFERKGNFAGYGADMELVGFTTCGGCPGDRAIKKMECMVRYAGAEKIHLSNCILYRYVLPDPKLPLEQMLASLVRADPRNARLNHEEYKLRLAESLKSGELPRVCPFKEKLVADAESLGVEVIRGTHVGYGRV